jgi:ribonuclease MRP protein subunit RMP1
MMDENIYPSPKAVEALDLEISLLVILHHRNKNQHHLQPFFKHLSILKRTLGRLLQLGESEYLLERLRTVTIPAAWEEFSRVVSRGEFVNLGVVLCACVGRIAYCLGGIVGAEGMVAPIEIEENVLEDTGEMGEVVMREVFMEETVEVGDIGTDSVPVTPSRLTSSANPEEEQSQETTSIKTQVVQTAVVSRLEESELGNIKPPARKKRKRKRKDDIDELFARLE